MEKSKYIKEVHKRLGEQMKKSLFEEIGLIGYIVIWAISSLIVYLISPLELLSMIMGLVPTIVLLVYKLINLRIGIIPEEIYSDQLKTIEDYQINELKISQVGFKQEDNDDDHELLIEFNNCETRKIIELEAIAEMVLVYYLDKTNRILYGGWRIPYNKGENILDQSEIRPNIPFFGKIAVCSSDYSKIKFGGSQEYHSIKSSEVIYKVFIRFSGKAEGETVFKNKDISFDIFIKPPKNILSLFNLAKGLNLINKDFIKKFLELDEEQRKEINQIKQ